MGVACLPVSSRRRSARAILRDLTALESFDLRVLMALLSDLSVDADASSLSESPLMSVDSKRRSLATSATSILTAFLSEARSPGPFLSFEGAVVESDFRSIR